MNLVLSYEYQRMWLLERDEFQKKLYPVSEGRVNLIKRYVASLKNNTKPPEIQKNKELFKMKKYVAN